MPIGLHHSGTPWFACSCALSCTLRDTLVCMLLRTQLHTQGHPGLHAPAHSAAHSGTPWFACSCALSCTLRDDTLVCMLLRTHTQGHPGLHAPAHSAATHTPAKTPTHLPAHTAPPLHLCSLAACECPKVHSRTRVLAAWGVMSLSHAPDKKVHTSTHHILILLLLHSIIHMLTCMPTSGACVMHASAHVWCLCNAPICTGGCICTIPRHA